MLCVFFLSEYTITVNNYLIKSTISMSSFKQLGKQLKRYYFFFFLVIRNVFQILQWLISMWWWGKPSVVRGSGGFLIFIKSIAMSVRSSEGNKRARIYMSSTSPQCHPWVQFLFLHFNKKREGNRLWISNTKRCHTVKLTNALSPFLFTFCICFWMFALNFPKCSVP